MIRRRKLKEYIEGKIDAYDFDKYDDDSDVLSWCKKLAIKICDYNNIPVDSIEDGSLVGEAGKIYMMVLDGSYKELLDNYDVDADIMDEIEADYSYFGDELDDIDWSKYVDIDDDYYDLPLTNKSEKNKYFGDKEDEYDNRSFYSTYKPIEKPEIPWESNSDTLVIHPNDHSTIMLAQIYEGKGYDEIHENNMPAAQLNRIIDEHDRIIMLGHGSRGGLIGSGVTTSTAPHFKDKKLFVIWCNADKYFTDAGIGKGQFITGNMPSEKWECEYAGCGSISKELMLENITYWSKLCADVSENCLAGDVSDSVDYIRKNYLELYGNHPVTIYNCERTQVFGVPQPLPAYEFKGKPLTGEDIPYDGFNEEEFLKHPVPSIPEDKKVKYTYTYTKPVINNTKPVTNKPTTFNPNKKDNNLAKKYKDKPAVDAKFKAKKQNNINKKKGKKHHEAV